ncbi:MAG: AAA family ATPase [Clostridiales bacterium]|nr:AAA family ATPase [Clostridiales bacterium]
MSRGSEYLTYVSGHLKVRIRELGQTIEEGQKDIASMNEYYWENYAEMDEYGYENYDNRQALLVQEGANRENRQILRRLEKMLDSPFFGSVDFRFEEDGEEEIFYIGIGNFSRERGGTPLIYDWRAPVSSLFYDYDSGPACYEAPGGVMNGEICSKWQYKIRRGQLIYEFESDIKIDDEILRQELGASSDGRLKSIVRTIQREQNQIIRNTKDKILAIQGVAGSGKTSVALHRIAWLLYHDRERLKSSNVLILSPSGVFSDYISQILPELGEETIREMSFDLFAYRELADIAADCEDRCSQIERQIAGIRPKQEARYRFKQSKAFVDEMEVFLLELEDRLMDFQDVSYKKLEMRADEVRNFFYNKFPDTPLLSRMDAVAEYFIDAWETQYGKDLAEEEAEEVRQKFRKMYLTTDLCRIYNWFLKEQGLPKLADARPENRILRYEDVYPLLYLKYRLHARTSRSDIRHLVIDEMQDYSYLQYVILSLLFSCSMTILGDKAQTIDERTQDVLTFLPGIFGKQLRCITMNKSYRNTEEIAEYAKKITDVTDIEYVARHGKPVEEILCHDAAEAYEKIRQAIKPDAFETAAVLTMTEAEAKAAFEAIRQSCPDVSYIDRDSSHFRKGLTVTTFYLAKGLEFDQVFVLGGDEKNPLFRQYQYICATRALHELHVFRFELP